MLRFLLPALAFVVVLYALIDVALTPGASQRALPKPVWFLVVLLLPVIGAVCWFVWGRPRDTAGGGRPGRRRGPVAPDDDPTFLRELDDQAWREQMRRRREGRQPSGPDDPAAGPGPGGPGTGG